MSTSPQIARSPHRLPRPKLDGTHPLLKAVTREVAVKPGENVVRQGDVPRAAHLLIEGQTCRYRLLRDGRRQITAILVPGDVCDLEAVLCGRADYAVEALTPSILGELPAEQVGAWETAGSDLRRALWRQLLRDQAIAREWIVGLGRRSAKERLAHFLCELRERMRKVDCGEGDSYDLNLTQADFADVLGLSVVHVNRTLQQLRHEGLFEFRSSVLRIIDAPGLMKLAGFDPAYLEPA